MEPFKRRLLGKTGFWAGPLGVGSSYGVGAVAVEEAFDRGVNYFYWAWRRRAGVRDGLRNIISHDREKIFIVITSILPGHAFIRRSVIRALKDLKTDYIDGLQFYVRKEKSLTTSQLDTARILKEEGLIKHIGVTGHHRPNFPRIAPEDFSAFAHVRYNAVHRGAEEDIFPLLSAKGTLDRPGIVAFTATCWGQLMKASLKKLDGLPSPTAGDCYRFVLSHNDVDIAITGPANDEQMRHALDAVDKGPMTEDELEWMRKVGDRLRR